MNTYLNQVLENWKKIQSLDKQEYMEYVDDQKKSGREFRFLQINYNGDKEFIFQHRKMIINDNNEVKFFISASSDIFDNQYRSVILNKEEFVTACLEYKISQKDLDYFFGPSMDMTDEDWELY
jgi:hypothetical protein